MTAKGFDGVLIPVWADNLDEVDREIARLALVCDVRILEPSVVRRLLHNDASVCGVENPMAFRKLRELLMLHFALDEKLVDAFGRAQTLRVEEQIVERLKKSFPDLAAGAPPAGG